MAKAKKGPGRPKTRGVWTVQLAGVCGGLYKLTGPCEVLSKRGNIIIRDMCICIGPRTKLEVIARLMGKMVVQLKG